MVLPHRAGVLRDRRPGLRSGQIGVHIIARDLQTWRRAEQRKGRPRSRVARDRRRALKKVEDALAADPAYLETGADLVVNQLLKGAIAEILVGAGRVEVVPR